MPSLTRYLLRQLTLATLTVTITLSALVLLIRSLRLIDYVINRGVTLVSMAEMMMLLVPSIVAVILPIGVFAAVMFVYHKMTADRELVVMRAAGVSHIDLTRPALYVALAATVVGFALNLYVSPQSYRSFKELQTKYRNSYANVLLQEGRFNTPIEGVTVYVRSRAPDGELRGIFVHDNRERRRPVTWMAERGAINATDAGPQVVMFNGNRQEMSADTGRLTLVYFDRGSLDLEVLEPTLNIHWRDPRERFLTELLFPADTETDRRYHNELVAEGHRRLATPFYPIAFVLVALSLMLTGNLDRRGQAGRIALAILGVAGLQIAGFNALNMATAGPELIVLIYLVPLAPTLVAGYVLIRPAWRSRAGPPPLAGATAPPA